MRPTFRLVPDFILPSLNQSTYGKHLHWEDKRFGSFKISRVHQSSESWNEHCIEVYKDWSVKKRLWKTDDPKRITKAKHRLITALRRNSDIEILEKESSFYRFRVVQQNIPGNGKESREDVSSEMNKIMIENQSINETVKTADKIMIENQSINETVKTADAAQFDTIYDHTDIFEFSKENIDSSLFTNYDTPTYAASYSSALAELYENTPKLFPMSGTLNEEFYCRETSSTDFSDRCCCDVLLDNYVCNQKCIWHGSQV